MNECRFGPSFDWNMKRSFLQALVELEGKEESQEKTIEEKPAEKASAEEKPQEKTTEEKPAEKPKDIFFLIWAK